MVEPAKLEITQESCGCPCKHMAPIEARAGFILCVTGKEKLCPECVVARDDTFVCHGEHDGKVH